MNAKTGQSKESIILWMVKESAMKNYETEIGIAKAFIGVIPIRNQAEKVQDGIPKYLISSKNWITF